MNSIFSVNASKVMACTNNDDDNRYKVFLIPYCHGSSDNANTAMRELGQTEAQKARVSSLWTDKTRRADDTLDLVPAIHIY